MTYRQDVRSNLAWTDITWLLYVHHVSWAYYVQTGTQPDCANDSAETCAPVPQNWQPRRNLESAAALRRRPVKITSCTTSAAGVTTCSAAKAGTLPVGELDRSVGG